MYFYNGPSVPLPRTAPVGEAASIFTTCNVLMSVLVSQPPGWVQVSSKLSCSRPPEVVNSFSLQKLLQI